MFRKHLQHHRLTHSHCNSARHSSSISDNQDPLLESSVPVRRHVASWSAVTLIFVVQAGIVMMMFVAIVAVTVQVLQVELSFHMYFELREDQTLKAQKSFGALEEMVDDVVLPVLLGSLLELATMLAVVAKMILISVVLKVEQVLGYILVEQVQLAQIVPVSADMSLDEERSGISSLG